MWRAATTSARVASGRAAAAAAASTTSACPPAALPVSTTATSSSNDAVPDRAASLLALIPSAEREHQDGVRAAQRLLDRGLVLAGCRRRRAHGGLGEELGKGARPLELGRPSIVSHIGTTVTPARRRDLPRQRGRAVGPDHDGHAAGSVAAG